MNVPKTHYAITHDGLHIAYQVLGGRPSTSLCTAVGVGHRDAVVGAAGRGVPQGLASFSRLITFDKRGTGLPDRVSDKELPDLDDAHDDVRAVMDATGSERAALFGSMDAGHIAALYTEPPSIRPRMS